MRLLALVFACGGAAIPAARAQIIADGGYEAGPNAGIWTEFSTNFGSPVCQVSVCGTGTGTGPKAGVFWAWFGGTLVFEHGYVSQQVTIPAVPKATLEFALEMKVGSDPADFLEASIDGNLLQRWTADQSAAFQTYKTIVLDVSAYADAQAHTIRLESVVLGASISNFFVDDVRVELDTCYADCEEDWDKDVFDFLCFQGRFASQDLYSDCDQDGDWDIFDFLCFQDAFASCPL